MRKRYLPWKDTSCSSMVTDGPHLYDRRQEFTKISMISWMAAHWLPESTIRWSLVFLSSNRKARCIFLNWFIDIVAGKTAKPHTIKSTIQEKQKILLQRDPFPIGNYQTFLFISRACMLVYSSICRTMSSLKNRREAPAMLSNWILSGRPSVSVRMLRSGWRETGSGWMTSPW